MRLAFAVAALLVAGCSAGPDVVLPGVRTAAAIDDDHACGPALVPAGCVIVRIVAVDSGCAPEAPGYALCNATVWWTATSGAATPDATLETSVNGTPGPSCSPRPLAPCVVAGNVSWSHHFDGPGEAREWDLAIEARLAGAPEAASGWFRLAQSMQVRTQDADEADA